MSTTLQILHWLAAFITLAEAANKLERTNPIAPGMSPHARLVSVLKGLAWLLLALGAGVAVVMPILGALQVRLATQQPPSLGETAVLLGFAVLIIRTRVKEG